MPAKEECPNCGAYTRPIKMRAYSGKWNSYFCDQNCYESYSATQAKERELENDEGKSK